MVHLRAPARALPWAIAAGAVVAALVLLVAAAGDPAPSGVRIDSRAFLLMAVMAVTAGLGALLVARRPRNPVSVIVLVEGVTWLVGLALQATLVLRPHATSAALALNLEWIPGVMLIPALLLLYPDGRLPSRRFRALLAVIAVAASANLCGHLLRPGELVGGTGLDNPIGVDSGALAALRVLGGALIPIALLVATAALVTRRRRARGRERQQVDWLLLAALVVLVGFTTGAVVEWRGAPATAVAAFNTLPLAALPVAVAVGLLRYRLLDIEVVIDRALVAAAFVASATALYLALAVGIGATLGERGGRSVWIAALAAALAALALGRVRGQLERIAAHIAYRPPAVEPAAHAATPARAVAIRTLGVFRLFVDGALVPASAWRSKKARTLLKILLARRGRAVPRDQLMDILWPGEDPATLGNRLSVALSTVRSALDPQRAEAPDRYLETTREAVVLHLDELSVDSEQFLRHAEAGAASADAGRHDEARRELQLAEALYGGDFLQEDLYEDWSSAFREELRAAFIAVARALAQAAAEDGDTDDAVRRYLRLLEHDPLDENAHLGLVWALEDGGRHGDARRRHALYAARMVEVGRSPAPL